jgi:hypothetical protein
MARESCGAGLVHAFLLDGGADAQEDSPHQLAAEHGGGDGARLVAHGSISASWDEQGAALRRHHVCGTVPAIKREPLQLG